MADFTVGELLGRLGLETGEFDSGLEEAHGRFGRAGAALKTAAAGAAVGIGAALATGLSDAMDMQAANAKLTAQLGLTQQESARVGQVAGGLYASAYGESLDDVNEALAGVMSNIDGMSTASDADLQSVTGQVMSLSTAFDQDLGATTAAVGQMLKTGLAPNAQAAMDVIAAGMQNGVNKADDFLDVLNEYGTQFRKVGLDGETATGLISQGLKAGARDADLVADAVKEFSLRSVDGAATSSAAYQALGLDAATMTAQMGRGGKDAAAGLQTVLDRLRNMQDPVARNAAAVGLFGTQAEDLGAALYALDPSTAVAGLGQVAGASEKLDQTMGDTASQSIEKLKRQLSVGLAGAMSSVLPYITKATDFLTEHSGVVKMVALPIIVALGVAALIMGAQMALAWIMALGPVALAIAAIVGAAALIIANWDKIKAGAQALWSGIQAVWSMIADWFSGLPGAIGGFFSDVGSWLLDKGKAILNGLWAGVKFVAELMFFWYVQLPLMILGYFADAATWLLQKGKDILTGLWNGVKNLWLNSVGPWFANKRQEVLDFFKDAPTLLYNVGVKIMNSLWNGLKDKWNDVKGWVGGLGQKIVNLKGPPAYDARMLTPAGTAIMRSLQDGMAAGWPAIERQLGTMTGDLSRWSPGLPDLGQVAASALGPGAGGGTSRGNTLVFAPDFSGPSYGTDPNELRRLARDAAQFFDDEMSKRGRQGG